MYLLRDGLAFGAQSFVLSQSRDPARPTTGMGIRAMARVGTLGQAAPRRRTTATAVGAFIPSITQKAFEKFGFPATAILTDWQTIVGKELAAFTAPEKIRWPRTAKADTVTDDMPDEADCRTGQSKGATLVLRVGGARALEVQHRTPQILERVNAYFGYRAVTDLRILQAPIVAKRLHRDVGPGARATLMAAAPPSLNARAKLPQREPLELGAKVARDEDRLAMALARMGLGIRKRQQAAGRADS